MTERERRHFLHWNRSLKSERTKTTLPMCITNGYVETFLDLRKWMTHAVATALCLSICEPRDWHSQRQMPPRLLRSPNRNKCQFSPFNLIFIKRLTFIYFPNSPACLDSPAPGTLKIQIKEKEDISLTGIACYCLNQLTLLSMAVELMFSLLILLSRLQHTSYWLLSNICLCILQTATLRFS